MPETRRRARWLAAGAVVLLVLVAATALRRSDWWPHTGRFTIRRDYIATEWPFPTPTAELVCRRSFGGHRVLQVVVGGRSYPLLEGGDGSKRAAVDVFAGGERNRGRTDLLLTFINLLDDARGLC